MNYLNSKQLAFILDIEVQEAREKMVLAHCKSKSLRIPSKRNREHKEDIKYSEYPEAMLIEMLAVQLNLPTLQQSVDDIVSNYLVRPASKKWILCDYPEKQIKKLTAEGKKTGRIPFPSALKSMLPSATQEEIQKQWEQRFYKWFHPEETKAEPV